MNCCVEISRTKNTSNFFASEQYCNKSSIKNQSDLKFPDNREQFIKVDEGRGRLEVDGPQCDLCFSKKYHNSRICLSFMAHRDDTIK